MVKRKEINPSGNRRASLRAHETLKKKASYFKHLFQSVPAGVVLLDKEDCVIDCNNGFQELFRFSREEAVGKKINDLIVPPKLCKEGLNATNKVASGESVSFETVRMTKDGQLLDVSVTGKPIYIHGADFKVIAVYQDITSRKRTEAALRESEEKLRTIFSDANIGFTIVDTTGKLILNNKWHQYFLGYDLDDFQQKTILDITHPDDAEESKKRFSALIAGSIDNYRIEKRFVRKDGTIVWGDLSVSALKDQNGNVHMVIGMIIDITEKKQAEQILKQSELRLRELNSTKDTFISILSHDLRSPFTAILGFADILAENVHSYTIETIKEQVDIIRSQASFTLTLLDDILSWAKMQSGKMPFHPVKVQFCMICKMVTRNLKASADAKNIAIDCPEVYPVELEADENMLRTILRNLISNAIKFTPRNGIIHIKADVSQGNALISVSDSGVGIAKEHISKIWDIAASHSTTGTVGEQGSGYGLVLCKEFVEKHGGKIWVESDVGKGSTFCFTIPLSSC